jgi:hypothetical protein
MFQIMPQSQGKIVGVLATGKLSHQDYQGLTPALEALIKEHGKIRLLCFMDDKFAGLEAGAMWDDAKFYFPHRHDFENMAIVGGPQWVDLMMKLFKPLLGGEAKIFAGDQLKEAWEWLRSDT